MGKKNILILAHTDLAIDARPNRQIRWLKKDYNVYSIGKSASGEELLFIPFYTRSFSQKLCGLIFLFLGLHEKYYWDRSRIDFIQQLKEFNFDLIVAHEIICLPLAVKYGKNAKVILDAHEYSPENFSDKLSFRVFYKRLLAYLCKIYIPKCDTLFTVSESIRMKYEENFKVKKSIVVESTEAFYNISPSSLNPKEIKIIHHGIASSSRNLKLMIDMMDYLDDKYKLYLQLVVIDNASKKYLGQLRQWAKNNTNIKFIDPVPYKEIVPFTNQFDIGIILIPPVNLNLKLGLYNKFFQFVQARLALAVGPLIEMKKIVEQYKLGVVSENFTPKSMAVSIKSLSPEKIMHYKNKCHEYAYELSAEKTSEKVLAIINELTK